MFAKFRMLSSCPVHWFYRRNSCFFASNKASELCLPRPQPARRSWKHHGCWVTTIFWGYYIEGFLFTSHMLRLIWMGCCLGLKSDTQKKGQAFLIKVPPSIYFPSLTKPPSKTGAWNESVFHFLKIRHQLKKKHVSSLMGRIWTEPLYGVWDVWDVRHW